MRRVVVLAGGDSDERAVSLRSGAAIAAALADSPVAAEVLCIDPAATDLASYLLAGTDVVLNALHGAFGEDGQVQALLAQRGVPVTGCGAAASQLTFSKLATRDRLAEADLPIADGFRVDPGAPLPTELLYPLVVKPSESGSSVGLSLVRGPSEWDAAVRHATVHGPAVAEEHLDGPEWSVTVLGRRALPPIEVFATGPLFDAHAKYADDRTSFVPLAASSPRAHQLGELAVRAATACDTRGLVRVDMRGCSRSDRICILEINTVPGLTDRSLSPLAAMAAGMSLTQLAEWMVGEAV